MEERRSLASVGLGLGKGRSERGKSAIPGRKWRKTTLASGSVRRRTRQVLPAARRSQISLKSEERIDRMLKKTVVVLAVAAKAAILALAVGTALVDSEKSDTAFCCMPPPCPDWDCSDEDS